MVLIYQPPNATSPFRNGSHLPTTQCAYANFVDFATQRNGGGREKIYSANTEEEVWLRQLEEAKHPSFA
jgi:hypothetical protein